jgi:hypothetical protein
MHAPIQMPHVLVSEIRIVILWVVRVSLRTSVRVQQSLSVDGVMKVVETVALYDIQKRDREYTHAQTQMPHVLVYCLLWKPYRYRYLYSSAASLQPLHVLLAPP